MNLKLLLVFVLGISVSILSCQLTDSKSQSDYRADALIVNYSINSGSWTVRVSLRNEGDTTRDTARVKLRVQVQGETVGEGTVTFGPVIEGDIETLTVTIEGNQSRMADLGFDTLNNAVVVADVI